MGQSNLLKGLKDKYSRLAGEAGVVDDRIRQIRIDFESLPALEAQLERDRS